ncbi:unnamed protein product [Prunus armeniaca]
MWTLRCTFFQKSDGLAFFGLKNCKKNRKKFNFFYKKIPKNSGFFPYKYLTILFTFHTKSSYKLISFQYFSLSTPNFLLQNFICAKIQMSSSIEAGGTWTNVRRCQNLGNEISQVKIKKRKTITHGTSSEQCLQSVPVVRSVSEIMALLCPPKENTPTRRDPVEPPQPMMELSLYSIVSDYEDQ